MFSHRLLSPEGDTGSGGETANPAPESTEGTAEATPSQPAPQPDGITITAEEQATNKRHGEQAAESSRQFQRLKDLGFNSFDDAHKALQDLGKLRSEHGGIMDAMLQPAPVAPTETPSGQPLTLDDVNKSMDARFAELQQNAFSKEHSLNTEREDQLIGEAWSDPQFKNFVGDTSLEDAMAGKGNALAQGFAAILDQGFAAVAGRYPGGQAKPVTNADDAAKAKSWALDFMRQSSATTILAAASDVASEIQPTNEPQVSAQQEPMTPDQAEAEEQKRKDDIAATYEAAMKKATGGTASRVFG